MVEDSRSVEFTSASPDATRRLGRRLGEICRGGEVLFLYGDLGSGKTCFAQGLAEGLAVPARSPVTSPTFIVHAEYRGRLIFNHLDLYRLDGAAQLPGFGIDEMLADADAVTAIEWPELLAEEIGEFPRLDIFFTHTGESERLIRLAARGAAARRLLEIPERFQAATKAQP